MRLQPPQSTARSTPRTFQCLPCQPTVPSHALAQADASACCTLHQTDSREYASGMWQVTLTLHHGSRRLAAIRSVASRHACHHRTIRTLNSSESARNAGPTAAIDGRMWTLQAGHCDLARGRTTRLLPTIEPDHAHCAALIAGDLVGLQAVVSHKGAKLGCGDLGRRNTRHERGLPHCL